MSEVTTPKFFKIMKTVPGDVMFILHPFSNPELSKLIKLTARTPSQQLPLDWALGIFMTDSNYTLYRKKIISFENNAALVRAAYEAGAYFSEELDFEPAPKDYSDEIFAILKTGNRQKIVDAVSTYGEDRVREIAIAHCKDLTTGVVNMLETILKVQLIVDGGND